MHNKSIILALMLLFTSLWAQKSEQIVLVESANWNANHGTMRFFQLTNRSWSEVGEGFKVALGRNGMGWGVGLHKMPANPLYKKHEGDGRSPAGIFRLLQGFGYHQLKLSYPYERYSQQHHCVDDSASKHYNNIVDSRRVKKDYKSFEKMRFAKNYYEYGVVVDHNHFGTKEAIPQGGSCIFLHIKSVPTAGCTVMSKEQMVWLLHWLRPSAHPLLIQAPHKDIKRLAASVGLKL